MAQPNYRQQKKQREQAKKKKNEEKQKRKSDKPQSDGQQGGVGEAAVMCAQHSHWLRGLLH